MLIHAKSRSVLLKVRDLERIRELFPKRHKLVDIQGHNVAVKHGLDETKILNNLGIKVPSPILYHYDWPGRNSPWDHQKQTAAFLTLHRRAFVLNEAGTAKTASSLWAADYLMREGHVRKCLVIATLSTLESVWMHEIFAFLMHRTSAMLYGSRRKRLDMLAMDVDFYVINHDGVEVIQYALIDRDDIDLIILDEASDYRNARTDRYKVLESLLKVNTRLWPMTATPCPDAPTDAWALAKLVNPDNVPKYFSRFRDMTMIQRSTYKWVPRLNAEELVFNALQPAIRYVKKDCLDLPPVVTKERFCEMSEEQKTLFRNMQREMVMEAQSGVKITAVNAADRITKLRQLLCGSVKDAERGVYVAVNFRPRFNLLVECLQEAHAKVIVVIPFKGIVKLLNRKLSTLYSCAVLNGDVTPRQRNRIINEFKTLKDPHVLLCHPKVMAHGLNLTVADTLIFYAPIYSNDQALQVVERFNRKGQTRKMTVVRMSAHPIERQIYNGLDVKQTGQERILSLYRKIVEV